MSFSVSDDGRHALINVAQQVKKIIFLHFSGGGEKNLSTFLREEGKNHLPSFLRGGGVYPLSTFLRGGRGGILLLDISEGRGKLSCYISQGRWKTSSYFISHEGWLLFSPSSWSSC